MLTESAVRTAQPSTKPTKLYDAEGLYMLVNPNGSKWWRFKYRYAGKEKLLSLGVWPDVPLLTARKARDEARRRLAEGTDPSEHRQEQRQALITSEGLTFGSVANEWLTRQAVTMADATHRKAKQLLDDYVLPVIGNKPMHRIITPQIMDILRPLETEQKYHTAQRVRFRIGQVFRYAGATGQYNGRDLTADLKGVLISPKDNHHPAITEPAELSKFVRALDNYPGKPVSKLATQLAMMLFVRPGEFVVMEWSELDLDNGQWNVPRSKMKMDRDHVVPLSTQATSILHWLKPITGCYPYVFPNERDYKRPMHRGSINRSIELIGYAGIQTAHGFRATARTILDEVLGYRPDWLELQLAHEVRDPNGRAYNRTAFLAQRKEMMQGWADYLDQLRGE